MSGGFGRYTFTAESRIEQAMMADALDSGIKLGMFMGISEQVASNMIRRAVVLLLARKSIKPRETARLQKQYERYLEIDREVEHG